MQPSLNLSDLVAIFAIFSPFFIAPYFLLKEKPVFQVRKATAA